MSDKLYWPIENLKNWPDNPREITKQKYQDLKDSLQKEGQLMPLLVDTRPEHLGETIGGNMTLRALRELGVKEVWVEPRLPTSDAHAFELAVKHNMRYGSWTEDLAAELAEKYKLEIDLPKLDLDIGKPIDLQTLLDRYGPEVEEDEPPPLPEEATSKLGEVYQLGRHRLMCGDATKIEDVEKLMDGEKADMVFTDPPYNLGVDYSPLKGVATLTPDDLSPEEYTETCKTWFTNLKVACEGTILITPGTQNLNVWYSIEKPRWILAWVKMNGRSRTGLGGMQKWEPIVVYNPKRTGDIDVIEANTDRIKGLREEHVCPKPQKLMAECFKRFTERDNIVLDIFGGSGSTLIAAEQTNRTCYMMEIDPKYCDVIRTRYENFINSRPTN